MFSPAKAKIAAGSRRMVTKWMAIFSWMYFIVASLLHRWQASLFAGISTVKGLKKSSPTQGQDQCHQDLHCLEEFFIRIFIHVDYTLLFLSLCLIHFFLDGQHFRSVIGNKSLKRADPAGCPCCHHPPGLTHQTFRTNNPKQLIWWNQWPRSPSQSWCGQELQSWKLSRNLLV